MCQMNIGCKNPASFVVIQKAIMARPESRHQACEQCARKVGRKSKEGPVIDLPNMDGRWLRVERV